MIHLTASAGYGYGGKQYIARITGRDSKFTFAREFIGRKGGKRNESCEADVDEPGLYEARNIDKKGNPEDEWTVVGLVGDDLVESLVIDKELAMKIARALDGGRRIEQVVELVGRPSKRDPSRTVYEVHLVSARQAEAKEVAQTIDTATEACWAVLQALPEKEAKKVLVQLRVRVTPPKPAAAMGLTEETPSGVVADANQDAGVSEEALGLTPTPTTGS